MVCLAIARDRPEGDFCCSVPGVNAFEIIDLFWIF